VRMSNSNLVQLQASGHCPKLCASKEIIDAIKQYLW
jgi:hypothetical protein